MADQITLYGIPNCDSVKKARKWLDGNSVSYDFHNYKKDSIDSKTLTQWCKKVGWEVLLNKRGTTWRKLSEDQQSGLNQSKAIALMIENTSIIKRPVMQFGDQLLVGFDESTFEEHFS